MHRMQVQTGFFLSLIIVLSGVAYSQGINSPPSRDDIIRDNLERRMNTMRNADTLARRNSASSREAVKARYFRPVLDKDLRRRIKIDPKTTERHKQFLASTGSGITRIVSPENCGSIRKLRKLAKCYQRNANVREFANAYSFRESRRTVFARSDIAVSGEYLVAGRHSVQTLLAYLGNIEINDVSEASKGIRYLLAFRPKILADEIDKQFAMLDNGVTVASYSDGEAGTSFTYSKRCRIRKNGTYAIRSIAYRPTGNEPLPKDQDVIVIFKVLGEAENGAVTILWKELVRSTGREMTFN